MGVLCVGIASSAAAQQTAQVTGRLVDRTSGLPVTAGNVRLDTGTPVNVDVNGTFRLQGTVGLHTLFVRALGYAPWQRDITLRVGGDTIVVDLTPRPFVLDTVRAESRTVRARTTIRDAASRILLADVEVTTNTGVVKSSGHTGLVTVDVPIGDTTYVMFNAFSYLPLIDSLFLERDTSFTVWLRPDPIAARMIDLQVAKLAERMQGKRFAGKSVLTRREVMSGSAPGMFTILERESWMGRGRGACVLIDEVYQKPDFKDIRNVLEGILPDRVERVERVQLGSRRIMIRIYTREFIRDMMSGRVALKPISAADCF